MSSAPIRVSEIRPIALEDMAGLANILEASGLFVPNELEEMIQMLADHFAGKSGSSHFWIADYEAGVPIGLAYCAPERMTQGTWNLYFIAVHPRSQRRGSGSALVHYVEQALTARGERLLLVETTGLDSFEATRAFYRKCGFTEEARIREFYGAGVDKVVFWKKLPLPAASAPAP